MEGAQPPPPPPGSALLPGGSEAILVDDVSHSYGKTAHVLRNLSMRVARGRIYGLLGPSGAGKTTLLKLLLGRLQLQSGSVLAFGYRPGELVPSDPYAVPGRAVGYQPQELALYPELSIADTLSFHGRLRGMSASEIASRQDWLLRFLDLPSPSRSIAQLSGGQQRRVSLAVALLDPVMKIALLDEPTVGLDPMLRAAIWVHLRELADQGVTVIITTHYVEEAMAADRVGLMRGGRLLAEDAPRTLLQRHSVSSLEDVFLKLCRADADAGNAVGAGSASPRKGRTARSAWLTSPRSSGVPNDGGGVDEEQASLLRNRRTPRKTPRAAAVTAATASRPPGKLNNGIWPTFSILSSFAVLARKLTTLSKYRGTVIFAIIAPCLEMIILAMVMGGPPHDLNIGVVNHDEGFLVLNFGDSILDTLHVNHSDAFIVTQYDSVEEANAQVRAGRSWGTLALQRNFTAAAVARYVNCERSHDVAVASEVHMHLDMSNQQIVYLILREIQQVLLDAAENTFHVEINQPIHIGEPIYGTSNPTFIEFIAPGMIVVIVFAFSLTLSAVAFVQERVSATVDRVYAAGCGPLAMLTGHIIAHSLLLIVQLVCLLFITFVVMGIPNRGSLVHLILIAFLLGVASICVGPPIAQLVHSEFEAVELSLAIFFMVFLTSGVIWPLESAPHAIFVLAHALPTKWSTDAYRSVMLRGWGIEYHDVYMAYLVNSVFTIIWLAVAYLLLRMEQPRVGLAKRWPSLMTTRRKAASAN